MQKKHDYLVCFDSDGCIFDTMEVKHKECFIPNIIKFWNLESVSKYARSIAEYVNLYSVHRGVNRFPGLVLVFDLLDAHPDAVKRGYKAPDITSLRKWVEREKKLGNPALRQYVAANPDDEVMSNTFAWSLAVNESVEEIVRFVPPFPYVKECFEMLDGKADIIVVSGTPSDALAREWSLHGLDKYVSVIAGQEMGSKKDCIAAAKALGYDEDKVVMIGDAPGDKKAAAANKAKFFPINPMHEDASWERFANEALQKFLDGGFDKEYQDAVAREFDKLLPDSPTWSILT